MPKAKPAARARRAAAATLSRQIAACGAAVEASLARSDLALTMGGEPTFVPLDPTGAEWSTAALGPTKLDYARRLAQRLIAASHPGAMVLETAGKHYPGEPLPRWTVLLQQRADGQPLWRDPSLLKADDKPGRRRATTARQVIQKLARNLGLKSAPIRQLSEAADPLKVTGFVLPIDHVEGTWRSDDWRNEICGGPIPLIPGDSAAGLRLPLGQLGAKRLRRATTVEIKHGCVTIFVPPLMVEGYVEFLARLEAALTDLKVTDCVLTGYAPPPDPRLTTLGFASDPGVLEINLAPCATWADYDEQVRGLYAAATAIGLTARKLQFNGRETGTGGGAHLVFGGPPGLYSPFFAFSHLLPSVIRYLQHHPALSYAFTGLYMGPSSQAPRIDESTYEALYELEIACAGAEKLGLPPNLEQFDLLFRDLLMDRSGNTHRAELSVDKLWNPFAGNGRLGLIELRAFESHPDAATLSLIGLFLRAIVTRLAADPFKAPFVRWGGELHDRFFLPTFIWQDLAAIAADLADHAIPFDVAWLRSYWEWRFPRVGAFKLTLPADPDQPKARPVPFTVTFRQALEAWPLLGESPNAGTVSRTVDASCDRIEACVSDPAALASGLLLVNGYPCEFRSAGDHAACGVRYRAFQLNPALHPHVPVHAPLLLEWVDRATLTVVAAARWHVWNPAGAPYTARPKTAAEAQARFTARWQDWPHTIGQSRWIPAIDFPPEGQYTLDLRRYPAQSRA